MKGYLPFVSKHTRTSCTVTRAALELRSGLVILDYGALTVITKFTFLTLRHYTTFRVSQTTTNNMRNKGDDELGKLRRQLADLHLQEPRIRRRIQEITQRPDTSRNVAVGDNVAFGGTRQTRAGTGTVIDFSKDSSPFVIIQHHASLEIVKRKPHSLTLTIVLVLSVSDKAWILQTVLRRDLTSVKNQVQT